jgi:tryptophanyl-tRNA synthetase
MSLDGVGKMSKSVNQMNTLYLADTDEQIRKKIMKAKTDSGPTEPNSVMPDYIENLFTLLRLVSAQETIEKFEADFNNCVIRYGDVKKQLAEDMVRFMAPIRERALAIQQDADYLAKVIATGREKARASASETLAIVRNAMGVNY